MQTHELYDYAVHVFLNQSERLLVGLEKARSRLGKLRDGFLQTVLDLRGDWLMKDDRCGEAALCNGFSFLEVFIS